MFVTFTLLIALIPTSISAKSLYTDAVEYLQEIKIKYKYNAYGASFTRIETNNLKDFVPGMELSKITNNSTTVTASLPDYNQKPNHVRHGSRSPHRKSSTPKGRSLKKLFPNEGKSLYKYFTSEEWFSLYEPLSSTERSRLPKGSKAKSVHRQGSSDEECDDKSKLLFKDKG